MKKFFEKYDLIKLSGIMVLLSVLLTWFIPVGYFSGTEFVSQDLSRVGISTFLEYSLLGIYYFSVLVTFLFVLGGFYQVLSKRAGYQQLIKNISEKLKGCEIPTVLVISLIFAILCSLTNEYFPLLAFIPFVISILNKMKVDKISAFVATFGGLLVGTIGSTFSTKLAGLLTSELGVASQDVLTTQTILFVTAFVLLAAFTILRLRKQKDNKKFEEYDMFEVESPKESKKAPKTWPYVIGIILFTIVTVLAYLPWKVWEIELFTNITEWINTFELFKVPIVTYIFGEFKAFGEWDIFTVQKVMVLVTLLIHLFGHMPLNEVFDCYGKGFKNIGKLVAIMLTIYTIVIFNYTFPVIPAVVNWITGLSDGFNGLVAYLSSFVVSMFSIEMPYAITLAGTYLVTLYTEAKSTVLLIMQMSFGLTSFFVPSSVILMMGLSYLDIKYKDWMKFIWKFLLALLAISIVIILIIA